MPLLQRIDRRTVLAMLAMLGFLGATFYLMVKGMPDKGGEALLMMLGALVVLVKDSFAYDFNTSASSAAKDDTIKAAAMAALPQADAPKGP